MSKWVPYWRYKLRKLYRRNIAWNRKSIKPSFYRKWNYKRMNYNNFVLDIPFTFSYEVSGVNHHPVLRNANGSAIGVLGNSYYWMASDLIVNDSRWNNMLYLYQQIKVVGIKLEIKALTPPGNGHPPIAIGITGYTPNQAVPATYAQVIEIPKSITVTSQIEKYAVYKKIYSDWVTASDTDEVNRLFSLFMIGRVQTQLASTEYSMTMRVYTKWRSALV